MAEKIVFTFESWMPISNNRNNYVGKSGKGKKSLILIVEIIIKIFIKTDVIKL